MDRSRMRLLLQTCEMTYGSAADCNLVSTALGLPYDIPSGLHPGPGRSVGALRALQYIKAARGSKGNLTTSSK